MYADYSECIAGQIRALGKASQDLHFDSIFFGGGTPSLIGSRGFGQIFEAIYGSLFVDGDCEITVEVNPKTVDKSLAKAFKEAGVNRVSIGLQSANDNELAALSRIHTYSDFLKTHTIISETVTENISADIMYGIPLQSITSLQNTLDSLIKLRLAHVSAYMLKVEKGTPFDRMGKALILPDEDSVCDMYELIYQVLDGAKIKRYEISNFAKNGFRCRHNLKYWEREEYIGLGPSAHSFIDGVRYSYRRDLEKYLSTPEFEEYRVITDRDAENERIMLGLRLEKGIAPSDALLKRASKFIKEGYIKSEEGRLFFTTKGFLVSNYILSELIDF